MASLFDVSCVGKTDNVSSRGYVVDAVLLHEIFTIWGAQDLKRDQVQVAVRAYEEPLPLV